MNEDLVIKKVISLEERVGRIEENMVTKREFSDMMKGQDKMIAILERLDQERVLTEHHLKQVGEEHKALKNNQAKTDDDVRKIKIQLKIA
jgi:hypothetical protein